MKYVFINDSLEFKTEEYGGVKIDCISDLHLDFYKSAFENESKFVERFLKEKLNVTEKRRDKALIIAGDISHTNSLSKYFIQKCSKIWEYVLVIPGNHDYYFQEKNENRYSSLIESLEKENNVIFLKDKVKIFEYKGIKIAGTFMHYNLHTLENYVMWKGLLNDSKYLSRDFLNKKNNEDVLYYNEVIEEVDIFISHVPIVNLDGLNTTEHLFLNVDVSPIKGVLYISGHTHKKRNSIETYAEGYQGLNVSYGYPYESAEHSVEEHLIELEYVK